MTDHTPTTQQPGNKVLIVNAKKSTVLGLILAFFFGPLGLLYSTVLGGVIMIIVALIAFFILPIIGPIVAWLISFIWAFVALVLYNGKVKREHKAAMNS